jgi:hypothetical protein
LDDTTVLATPQAQINGQPPTDVQVRDIALLAVVRLTGQSPADYGFPIADPQQPRAFDVDAIFRNNDPQRASAITKWRAWWAEHKNDKPPAPTPNPPSPDAPTPASNRTPKPTPRQNSK